MHSDFPHYLIPIHSPSPHTPCPPPRTLDVTLPLTTNRNPRKKEKKSHLRALLNICKQPAQESQPISATGSLDSGSSPAQHLQPRENPHLFLSCLVRVQSCTLPGGGRKIHGCSEQVVDVGEVLVEGKLGSCGLQARGKHLTSSFPAF